MDNIQTVALVDLVPLVEKNQELLDYWRGLYEEVGGVPPRSRFDPMSVPRVLPNVMVVERDDDGVLKVRLMGTALADRVEDDLTGKELLSSLPDGLRQSSEFVYGEVLDTPCVLLAKRHIARSSGAVPMIEALHLPWCDAAGTVRFVISAFWGIEGPIVPDSEDKVEDWDALAERRRAPV